MCLLLNTTCVFLSPFIAVSIFLLSNKAASWSHVANAVFVRAFFFFDYVTVLYPYTFIYLFNFFLHFVE